MSSRLAFLVVLSFLVSLSACAAHYNRKTAVMMDLWIGKPVTQVIEEWGPPTTVYDEGSQKVYVWHSSRTSGGGSYSQQIPTGTRDAAGHLETKTVVHGAPVRTVNTYRMFWVDADGTIKRWKFGRQ